MDDATVEIVADRDPEGYGFMMKTAASGVVHRVLPLRDPDQPRFWCVVVVRCSPGGLPDRTEPAWIGRRGLRREELAETMQAIRADLSAWLAEDTQALLRERMLASVAEPTATSPAATPAGMSQHVAAPSGTMERQVLEAIRGPQETPKAVG